MTNDQRLGFKVNKFAPGTTAGQHLISQMFKDGFKFTPLDVGGSRLRTEPLNGFLMFGHVVQAAPTVL